MYEDNRGILKDLFETLYKDFECGLNGFCSWSTTVEHSPESPFVSGVRTTMIVVDYTKNQNKVLQIFDATTNL